MGTYKMEQVLDHIEVYTQSGEFVLSADNMDEAFLELCEYIRNTYLTHQSRILATSIGGEMN